MAQYTKEQREENIEELRVGMEFIQEYFREPQRVNLFNTFREDLDMQYPHAQAMLELGILSKEKDENDKRHSWYQYKAGNPTFSMAEDVWEKAKAMQHELRSKRREDNEDQEKPEKPKVDELTAEGKVNDKVTLHPGENFVFPPVDTRSFTAIEKEKLEGIEAAKERVNEFEEKSDVEKNTHYLSAALRILGYAFEDDTVRKIARAVRYTDKKGGKGNLEEILKLGKI